MKVRRLLNRLYKSVSSSVKRQRVSLNVAVSRPIRINLFIIINFVSYCHYGVLRRLQEERYWAAACTRVRCVSPVVPSEVPIR